MLASIASVLSAGVAIAQTAKTLYDLGKDVAPQLADLKRIYSGEKITVEELAEMRARSDALNTEIESQPED